MGFISTLVFAILACSPKPSFKNVDITGSTAFGKDFSLIDTDGNTKTLADYKGKAVVMFFGFTQCPDVCPTTLTEMQDALQLLGPQAEKVQVLFVTVDPERDTARVLAQYVPAFNPRFVGLRPADEAALEKVAKDFKIYYKKVPGTKPGSYTMDHTAGSYVFDQNGQLRLYIKHAQGPEVLAHDLKNILQ
ncbi:MAG: SCO family protein [Polynucleobacter sp.]|jgi:protein SCO1/2|nr:SCO family protein [Polynucleobacter sp.]